MKHVSPHRDSRLAVILVVTALIVLWASAAMAMTLNSPAFKQNGHIPSKYTCEGEDVSPPLAWESVPAQKADITLDLKGATKAQIERSMQGHVLANAPLIGTYQKGDR